jgi:hypothetical protein
MCTPPGIDKPKVHRVREKMMQRLQEEFKDMDLHFAIGGQISMDVFPGTLGPEW